MVTVGENMDDILSPAAPMWRRGHRHRWRARGAV